jgi:hypothetical protein
MQLKSVLTLSSFALALGIPCSGACGGQSPGGCWCDAACSQYGDCCADKVQVCG